MRNRVGHVVCGRNRQLTPRSTSLSVLSQSEREIMGPVECRAFDDNSDTTSQLGYIGSRSLAEFTVVPSLCVGSPAPAKAVRVSRLGWYIEPETHPAVILSAWKVKCRKD